MRRRHHASLSWEPLEGFFEGVPTDGRPLDRAETDLQLATLPPYAACARCGTAGRIIARKPRKGMLVAFFRDGRLERCLCPACAYGQGEMRWHFGSRTLPEEAS